MESFIKTMEIFLTSDFCPRIDSHVSIFLGESGVLASGHAQRKEYKGKNRQFYKPTKLWLQKYLLLFN